MDFDIEEALRVYLDPGPTGGYQPVGSLSRLRARYGADAEQVQERISAFLDPIYEFDASSLDCRQIGERAEARARQLHPDLDPILCRSIGNALSYAYWK